VKTTKAADVANVAKATEITQARQVGLGNIWLSAEKGIGFTRSWLNSTLEPSNPL
jgi:hypothetical protein